MRAIRPTAIAKIFVAAVFCCAVVPVAQAETVAITGGRVFPVSGPSIDNGTIIITDGKIVAVGVGLPVPAGAKQIDATGKWVTPGLIDAASKLGLEEISAVPDTVESKAKGEHAIAAAFRVWDGLNPTSVLWAPARNEGITSTVVVPTGGLVSGQAAFVDLVNGSVSAMVRRAPVGMVAQIGGAAAADTSARGELLMRLRELLDDARVYSLRKLAYESANTRPFAAGRIHLDAMLPVLAGRIPLMVSADKSSDIQAALALARDFKLRLMIIGGAEAWMVADDLAKAKVPVLTTALENIPSSFAALGSRQENAALLRKAGVTVLITAGAGEAYNVRNIKQHAGNAVAYGMTWEDALRAVTLAPAEAFGLDATLGSLRAGRDGTVVVWSGDPFEFSTVAERILIKGVDMKQRSRQDELIDRYKTLPP